MLIVSDKWITRGNALSWLHVMDYLNFKINSFASNNGFSYINISQNCISALSKMVLRCFVYGYGCECACVKKLRIWCSLDHRIRFCSNFGKLCDKYLLINNCLFTLASKFRQNNALVLRFWCVKCTNPKGECTRQASTSKRKYKVNTKLLIWFIHDINEHFIFLMW